jgi:predicted RNA-binding protein with TRAM domain
VIGNRRTLTYVAIALIVGASLALAVALARSDAPAAGSAGTATGIQSAATADVLADTGEDDGGVVAADPAKQEPLLDQFASKDPFIPLVMPSTGGGDGNGGDGNGGTGGETSLTAKVKVDGTSYSVSKGDKVPGGSPAFEITGITSGDVTFTVIDGKLKNGDSSITIKVGESADVELENGKKYKLAVTSVGSSGDGTTGGHTISVLSVTSQNGTAQATIEVDGKTYSDLKVGDVVDTSWGQIKIISINVGAQTVTIMHGDQTITLRAGQVVVK